MARLPPPLFVVAATGLVVALVAAHAVGGGGIDLVAVCRIFAAGTVVVAVSGVAMRVAIKQWALGSGRTRGAGGAWCSGNTLLGWDNSGDGSSDGRGDGDGQVRSVVTNGGGC